jgi:hypothetical protein
MLKVAFSVSLNHWTSAFAMEKKTAIQAFDRKDSVLPPLLNRLFDVIESLSGPRVRWPLPRFPRLRLRSVFPRDQ